MATKWGPACGHFQLRACRRPLPPLRPRPWPSPPRTRRSTSRSSPNASHRHRAPADPAEPGAPPPTISPRRALQDIPQGEAAPLNQVLLQAPGVAQDSFGQIHLRGEHANVQYRLNGVELPEGLSVFGDVIMSRFARSMSLITGALPAQCMASRPPAWWTSRPRSGISNPGLAASLYGGSWNWLEPSLDYGGRSGPVDYFVTLDGLHDTRGVENPTPLFNAIHDTTNQFHGLASINGVIDADTRINLILGRLRRQLPDTRQSRPAHARPERERRHRFQQRRAERAAGRGDQLRRAVAAKAYRQRGPSGFAVQPHLPAAFRGGAVRRPAVHRHRAMGLSAGYCQRRAGRRKLGGSTIFTLFAVASWRSA